METKFMGCVHNSLGGGVRRGLGGEGWKGGFQDLTMNLLRLGLALLDSSDCWLQQSC